jgi:hypothetical protein
VRPSTGFSDSLMMTEDAPSLPNTARVLSQLRVLTVLDAANRAGISPMTASHLHGTVYMSNALSPVWDLAPLTPKLLKFFGGPYDPDLQHNIDLLVGRGMVLAREVHYEEHDRDGWRVEASYSLNENLARKVLSAAAHFPDETYAAQFVLELCLALSALPEEILDRAFTLDATYSSLASSPNSIVSLAGSDQSNRSARAARSIGEAVTPTAPMNPAEEVHLYLRHLYRIAGRSA